MSNAKNLATSTVATAPSPTTSGTSLVVQSGHGVRFPSAPFFITVFPDGSIPDASNSEIVYVTGKSTDTFTIVRAQKGTSALSITTTMRVMNGVYTEDMAPFKNVMQFGAVGDGSSDDTAAIQACLDDVHNHGGGGTVFFPVGTYKITSALTFYSNMIIRGAGTDATKIVQNTASTTALLGNDIVYTSIRDLSIKTIGGAHVAGSGIELKWTSNSNTEQIHLQDLLISGYHVGISVQTLITSQINNVECFGCDTGIYMWDGGTSTNLTNTYMNTCGVGYYLDGCVYISFNGTAADTCGQGYYIHNSSGISFLGCGSEAGAHGAAPSDGRGWYIDSCVGIGFYNCWNYKNPSYMFYVTNSSSIVLAGVSENSPIVLTAINAIFIDTNCTRITVISPITVTANELRAGGTITTLISDSSGAMTIPGLLTTTSGVTGKFSVNGSSGQLFFLASPDGSEFNIGVDTSGTLSFYGAGGTTLHVNLLDGNLETAGTVRLSNAGVLQNTRVQKRTNSVGSSATPSINTDTTDEFDITALGTNITSMTTNLTGTPVNGDELVLRFKDNGSPRTITWGASFVSSGINTLLATTSTSKTHYVRLRYDGTLTKWVCIYVDATGY